MDDDKKRFYQHLNDQFHKPDDLDEYYSKNDELFQDGGFNHKGTVERLNANKDQEISVIRVAMLKNGNFRVDGGNAGALFLHGAAHEIIDVAKHQDAEDWDDDDD